MLQSEFGLVSSFGEAQQRGLPPALRHRDFRRRRGGLLASGFASQMVAVAVGWQVYAIHQSAFDLGLIGLAEFIPLPLLALPAGQLADRMPRVRLFAVSILAEAAIAGLLLLVTIDGARELWPFLTLAALAGAIQAFGQPAGRSLTPEIVPIDLLAGALASALRRRPARNRRRALPWAGSSSQSGPRRLTPSPS